MVSFAPAYYRDMNCYKQGCEKRGPQDTLYRVNAKGRPGIWACQAHRLEPDAELDGIIAAVEGAACARCWKPCDPALHHECCAEYWSRMEREGYWDGPAHRWTDRGWREFMK